MTIRRPRSERLAALAGFAERLEPGARLAEGFASGPQLHALQGLAARAGQKLGRRRVAEKDERCAEGFVGPAVFAGSDATEKARMATAIGRELGLEAFRIDLTKVVSKFIGETEKNLRKIFASAKGRSALLYFDEAEALFGKRSDVRDSHDRYAEAVSCLLECACRFDGMVILSVACAEVLNEGFRASVDTVVEFPD